MKFSNHLKYRNSLFMRRSQFLLSILILVGCTEKIDLRPGDLDKRLIVDATITNELKHHTVLLSRTKLVNDTSIAHLSYANVFVYDGMNTIVFNEVDTIPGTYLSSIAFAGVIGRTYELNINNVDINGDGEYEHYESAATMADTLVIDSINSEYYKPWKGVWIKCWAWDPPVANYYSFKAWRNGVLLTDSLFEANFTDDLFFNGNYTNGIVCAFLQDEKADEHIVNGDTLTLEIDNISKDFFNYLYSAKNEYWGYNPMFGGPPANVYTNISNNGLGIFRVYTISKSTVIAKNINREE